MSDHYKYLRDHAATIAEMAEELENAGALEGSAAGRIGRIASCARALTEPSLRCSEILMHTHDILLMAARIISRREAEPEAMEKVGRIQEEIAAIVERLRFIAEEQEDGENGGSQE